MTTLTALFAAAINPKFRGRVSISVDVGDAGLRPIVFVEAVDFSGTRTVSAARAVPFVLIDAAKFDVVAGAVEAVTKDVAEPGE